MLAAQSDFTGEKFMFNNVIVVKYCVSEVNYVKKCGTKMKDTEKSNHCKRFNGPKWMMLLKKALYSKIWICLCSL